MSNDHGKRDNKGQIPQRQLGTALRSFFGHVTSHDEEGVHAAICMVANTAGESTNDNTPMHVCSFGAGDPDTLAQIMVLAIDTALKEVPGFEEAWTTALRAKRLQAMVEQVISVVQKAKEQAAEAEGMEAAKPTVDALIEKLKGNPGAVPGSDTKH